MSVSNTLRSKDNGTSVIQVKGIVRLIWLLKLWHMAHLEVYMCGIADRHNIKCGHQHTGNVCSKNWPCTPSKAPPSSQNRHHANYGHSTIRNQQWKDNQEASNLHFRVKRRQSLQAPDLDGAEVGPPCSRHPPPHTVTFPGHFIPWPSLGFFLGFVPVHKWPSSQLFLKIPAGRIFILGIRKQNFKGHLFVLRHYGEASIFCVNQTQVRASQLNAQVRTVLWDLSIFPCLPARHPLSPTVLSF